MNDGMPLVYDHLYESGDRLDTNTQTILFMYNYMPKFMKSIMAGIARLAGLKRVADILNICHPKIMDELAPIIKERQHVSFYLGEKFSNENIDAILMPGFPIPAFKIEDAQEASSYTGHMILFNYLGFPSGSLPVTTVREGEDKYEDPLYKDNITECFAKTIVGSVGMPVGVMCGGISYQDEKVLALMKVLETLLANQN